MELVTKDLILRPFREADAGDVFEYLHEPTVNCFECMRIGDIEEAKRCVKERIGDDFYFAITLKDTGKVIGEIFGGPESHDPEGVKGDTVSPCWMLDPAYRHRGYMLQAATAYFDYLFDDVGVRRIYTYTEDYNIPCQKLCERLGMRKEGEFKEFVSFVNDCNGEPIYENTWQYAILKKEWKKDSVTDREV